jgi:hypothetical protein
VRRWLLLRARLILTGHIRATCVGLVERLIGFYHHVF